MKCKICKTGRDDLAGDICVDCLADKMAEIFDRSPHRGITMTNPDLAASTRRTIEDLIVTVAELKAEVARIKEDVVRLDTDAAERYQR